jgi:hypothetical protein
VYVLLPIARPEYTNLVYVDEENDLVVVARWIPGGDIDELLGLVIGSIQATEDGG